MPTAACSPPRHGSTRPPSPPAAGPRAMDCQATPSLSMKAGGSKRSRWEGPTSGSAGGGRPGALCTAPPCPSGSLRAGAPPSTPTPRPAPPTCSTPTDTGISSIAAGPSRPGCGLWRPLPSPASATTAPGTPNSPATSARRSPKIVNRSSSSCGSASRITPNTPSNSVPPRTVRCSRVRTPAPGQCPGRWKRFAGRATTCSSCSAPITATRRSRRSSRSRSGWSRPASRRAATPATWCARPAG